MSEIKEERTVKEKVTIAWQCDVCGVQTENSERYKQEWHCFSESHQAWGNDSVDSYNYYDVCSVDCFIKCLQDRLPDLLEYADRAAEIADMPVRFAQKLLDRLFRREQNGN